jgi:hypothetical protein
VEEEAEPQRRGTASTPHCRVGACYWITHSPALRLCSCAGPSSLCCVLLLLLLLLLLVVGTGGDV